MKKIIALACACAGMCVLSDTAESLSADPLRGTPAQQPRAEILATRVICKEPGRYIGWPTVCRRKNGELIAIFSGDRDQHVCPWGKVQLVRSADDGKTWSAPETIRNSIVDDRDAGITELADGTLVANWFTSIAWVSIFSRFKPTSLKPEARTAESEYMRHWSTLPTNLVREALGYWTMRSTDGGKTWEPPVRTAGTRPHNVLQLKDGRLLAIGCVYRSADHMLSTDPGFKDLKHEPIYEESTDGGRSWHRLSTLSVAADVEVTGLHEPHMAELPDGRLVAMYRYHAKDVGDGICTQTESEDGGRTWTPIRRSPIKGYPPHLTVLKDGRLLCVFGQRTPGNYGEWAVFSDDGGRTWDMEHQVLLCRHWNGDLGYPASVEMPDGTILTVYYQADKPVQKTADWLTSTTTCLMGTWWRPRPKPAAPAGPVQYVNPYIGCSYNGHCYAAAAYPFGLVQAGPDTGNTWWNYCSGYRYADDRILGFSQTHLSGCGCGDLGDLLVMPYTGDCDLARTNYTSVYRKETQSAQPGYYAVTLDDNNARVETTVSHRAAIYRIKYMGDKTPRLFADLQYGILNWDPKGGERRVRECVVEQDGPRSFSGRLRTFIWVEREVCFAVEFDHDVTGVEQLPQRLPSEKAPRGILTFDLPAGGTLKMKVAFSTVSPEAARANLDAEIPGWDFDAVRAAAAKAWNRELGRAELVGGTRAQKENWYTSLYHLFIQPSDITDVDGSYRGADDKVAKAPAGYYSTLSLWDTFRAAHPLYTIIAPERVDGFVGTMLEHARTTGFLPIWTLWAKDNQCMIGNHSIPVIVDAYLKGFRGFDAEQAYAAIRKTLTEDAPGRHFNFTDVWKKYGYYPFDIVKTESVSRTLEHAYDDWCAARLAEALGKKEDAAFFDRRANNWTNVFDRTVGFARGRDTKGNWRVPFSPFKLNVGGRGTGPKDFTEGNSWQYTWHVMQDPRGLIAAMGGNKKFLENLNGLFSQPEKVEGMGFALDATGLVGQYAHGNEPSHHTIYLFQYAGRPDRTADLVREVCDKYYRNEPEGLCGNDDCGQMSAWFLFSAMGFYPLNPCGGDYVLGAPQVPEVKLALPGGKTLRIVAKNLSIRNKHVKSVTFNGKPVAGFILKHADLMAGGEIVFEMCP